MSLPKINGLFRLTRDAESQYTASGTAVVKLGLAASEKYKDKETPCFINATAFGKMGEVISQYAGTKGTQIYLSGKLQTDQWQDKQTGQNRSVLTMIVEGFDFVGGQNTGQQAQQQGQQMNQQQVQNQMAQQAQRPMPNDFENDDVPF